MGFHGRHYTVISEHPVQGFRNRFDIGNGHNGFGVTITLLFLLLSRTFFHSTTPSCCYVKPEGSIADDARPCGIEINLQVNPQISLL